MTEEKRNVEILRELYASWNDTKAGSSDQWLRMIADSVKWRSISDGAPGMEFTNCCETKDDVVAYMEGLNKEWEMIHYTVDEFVAQGDRVVVLCHCGWTHRKTGKVVETPKVDVIRMKSSQIVEFFEMFDTAKAFAASQ